MKRMSSIHFAIYQELIKLGSDPRPWPEEKCLPIEKAVEVFPPIETIASKKRRILAENHATNVQQQNINMVAGTNHDAQPTRNDVFVHPRTINNKNGATAANARRAAEARQRRNERKANLALLNQCVTRVVYHRLNRMKRVDQKRQSTVLENTLRTVEAIFEERMGGLDEEGLDEYEVQKQAEKVCSLNMALLFDPHEQLLTRNYSVADSDEESVTSSTTTVRIPLADISTKPVVLRGNVPLSASFVTPLAMTKLPKSPLQQRDTNNTDYDNDADQKIVKRHEPFKRVLDLTSSATSKPSTQNEDQFVTPVYESKRAEAPYYHRST
jgi:hypothetical protein